MLSIRHEIYEIIKESLPDQGYGLPQPDCLSISDEELALTITDSWPMVNGKITIPFGFSEIPLIVKPYTLPLLYRYFTFTKDYENEEVIHELIRLQLNRWSTASNGVLVFEEIKNIKLFSNGMFFNAAGKYADHVGSTYNSHDNNGYIKQAFIYYFAARSIPDLLHTIAHEIQHALGMGKHLHEITSIKNKLQNTTDGLYCSLSPYHQEIFNRNVNDCTDCSYELPVLPTKLDERIFGLIIQNGGAYLKHSYQSAMETSLIAIFLSTLHNSIYEFAKNLQPVKYKNLMSDKSALLLADTIITTGMIAVGLPSQAILSFAIACITRYLPEAIKEKIPAKNILTHNTFSLYVFSISYAMSNGYNPLPLMASIISSAVSTATNLDGSLLPTYYVNKSLQNLTSCFSSAKVKDDKADATLLEIFSSAVPVNKHSFFAPKRQSWCQKIGSFFTNKPAVVEDKESHEAEIFNDTIETGLRRIISL